MSLQQVNRATGDRQAGGKTAPREKLLGVHLQLYLRTNYFLLLHYLRGRGTHWTKHQDFNILPFYLLAFVYFVWVGVLHIKDCTEDFCFSLFCIYSKLVGGGGGVMCVVLIKGGNSAQCCRLLGAVQFNGQMVSTENKAHNKKVYTFRCQLKISPLIIWCIKSQTF